MHKYLTIVLFSLSFYVQAQVTANFELAVEACIEERFLLENTSINASSYKWDLCLDDIDATPQNIPSLVNVGTNLNSLKIINDNGVYYGFGVSNTSLYRLEFGNSISNVPSVTNLGGFGVMTSSRGIDIAKSGSKWVGFIGHFINSGGSVLRLVWDDLTSAPTVEEIGNLGVVSRIPEVRIVQSSGQFYVLFAYYNGSSLIRLSLGSSLENNITAANTSNTSSLSNVQFPIGMDAFEFDGKKYVVFGSVLTKEITVYEIETDWNGNLNYINSKQFSSLANLRRVKIYLDDKVHAFVSNDSNLQLVDLYQVSPTDNFTLKSGLSLPIVNGIEHFSDSGRVYAFGANSSNMDRFEFRNQCSVNQDYSENINPSAVFNSAGTYPIKLTALDASGNSSTITKSITVTSNVAPQVNISTSNNNRCVSSPINFNGVSPEAITSWTWDFGNGDVSTARNPSYTYSSAGSYEVTLIAEGVNGCSNLSRQIIDIYDEPIASFSSSSEGTICSQKPVDFTNTTSLPAPATFAWDFGDGTFSTEENPTHTYSVPGNYDVMLNIEMAGCLSTITQSVSVNEGPQVSFENADLCFSKLIEFKNTSTGQFITGYFWDFGDGTTSTLANPSHLYDSPGTKNVLLTARTSNGCDYTISRSVEVYPIASVDFEVEPSCAGSPTQFLENVAVQNANISEYFWDFGLSQSNTDTSSMPDPSFIYDQAGTYHVSLQVTTEDGCVTSTVKEVVVNPLPNPAINYTAACLGEAYSFIGNSDDETINEYWEIRNSNNDFVFSSIESSFNYTFNKAGLYTIRYRQQNNNLCSRTTTTQIEVNNLPSASFNSQNGCIGNTITLTNTSSLNNNTIESYSWYIDENLVSNDFNLLTSFADAGEYSVTLELKTNTGCIVSSNSTININEIPSANFELGQEIGAIPFQLETDVELNNNETANWYLNNELIGSGNTLSTTINEEGIYFISLEIVNENGCEDRVSKQLNLQQPSLNFSVNSLQAIDRENYTEFIIGLENNGSLIPSYFNLDLNFGEYSVSERLEVNVLPGTSRNIRLNTQLNQEQVAGIDRLCLTLYPVSLPFEETNTSDNTACVGISTQFKVLNIYPNPSIDQTKLPVILPASGRVEVFIEQNNGQRLKAFTFSELSAGYNELLISRENLKAGIYFIRIRYNQQEVVKKVVFY